MDMGILASGGVSVLFDLPLRHLVVPPRRRKLQWARLPTTLPGVLACPVMANDVAVPIVAVHVRRVRLAGPRLAGAELEVRVKYGEPGASAQAATPPAVAALDKPVGACFTGRGFREKGQQGSAPETFAEFDTTVLFLGDPVREPTIRLRLHLVGRCGGRVLARAQVPLPSSQQAGLLEGGQEHELPLWKADDSVADIIGCIVVGVKMQALPLGDLRELFPQLGCQAQRDALVRDSVPVAVGEVVAAEQAAGGGGAAPAPCPGACEGEVLQGVPWGPLPPQLRRPLRKQLTSLVPAAWRKRLSTDSST